MSQEFRNKVIKDLIASRVIKDDSSSDSGSSDLLCVPIAELIKLEQARVDLYEFLEGKLSVVQMMQITNITNQIWKVANTKKWEK